MSAIDALIAHGLEPGIIRRGVERETVRVTADGKLVDKASLHPCSLGAKDTHQWITTDFAEAQIELVTDPADSIESLLHQLTELHYFVHQKVAVEKQQLWPLSVPPKVDVSNPIEYANYPTHFKGRTARRYREGLAQRYGANMQLLCGVHFNFSLDEQAIAAVMGLPAGKDAKDAYYVNLLGHSLAHGPLLMWLMAKTPASIRGSLPFGQHSQQPIGEYDEGFEHGICLRQSPVGYYTDKQLTLLQPIQGLGDYCQMLVEGIGRTHSDFSQLDPLAQLSDHLLQIPNELYLGARIKPKDPTTMPWNLEQAGAEYLELRLLDIASNSPIGVDPLEIHFVEIYCLWAACQPPQTFDLYQSQKRISQMSMHGLKPGILDSLGYDIATLQVMKKEWYALASALDAQTTSLYTQSVDVMVERLKGPCPALSFRQASVEQQALQYMQNQREFFDTYQPDSTMQLAFEKESKESLLRSASLPKISEETFQKDFAALMAPAWKN